MAQFIPVSDESRAEVPERASRRQFMKGAVAAAGLMAAPLAAAPTANMLPTVPLRSHQIPRLISGGNPLYGYAHFNKLLSDLMVEYFTDEQVVKYLLACQKAGINAWQSNYRAPAQRQFPKIRDAGCTMHWIGLADPWDVSNPDDSKSLIAGAMKCASMAAKVKPIGIAHRAAGIAAGIHHCLSRLARAGHLLYH